MGVKAVLNWLYPYSAACLCCNRVHLTGKEYLLCDDCRKALESLTGPFGQPIPGFERVLYPYRYHAQARELVLRLKYGSALEAADLLSSAMADTVQAFDFDVIVPVPLHERRRRTRGYNQAEELAKRLSAAIHTPVTDALVRTRATHRQARLKDPAARRKNVDGAFAARRSLEGMRVLLVDDVCTTGATASACLSALKDAKAATVTLLCAAGPAKKRAVK